MAFTISFTFSRVLPEWQRVASGELPAMPDELFSPTLELVPHHVLVFLGMC